MKFSNLQKFFNFEITKSEFQKILESEVKNYEKKINNLSSNIPVYVEEDVFLNINKKDIDLLVNSFSDKYYISYICEALMMAEKVKFENENIKDKCYFLTETE